MLESLSPELVSGLHRALSAGAIRLGVAAAVIVVLALLLPKGTRSRIRTPVVLLLVYVLVFALRLFVDESSTFGRALDIAGAFFFLAALGQSAFLLLVDAIVGGRLGRPLPRIFRDIVQVLVLSGVALATLRVAGVEPGSLLTTSALLTAVVGLSLQDTLGNLFAGLSIQAQRPFEVGDWIQIDPDPRFLGRVIEINWRATTVVTSEHVEVIIPNGALAKSPIRNFTKPTPMSRRSIAVQASYDASPKRVEQALLSAANGASGVKADPPPFVLMTRFDDSGITYQLFFFIEDFTTGDRIDSAVRQRVWSSFRRSGITIPFPIRDVYSHNVSADVRGRASAEEQSRKLQAIKGVDFLAELPQDALDRLATLSESCQYLVGEEIIHQGEAGHQLFIIQSGEVSVLLGRGKGSVAEIARLGPGKFFGEMSVMTGERRTATIQALTDCELVRVDKEAFQEILDADPKLAEQITQVLVERQIAREENINQRASKPRVDKEAKNNALLAAVKKFFSL